MRTMPLALACVDDESRLRHLVERCSKPTHANREAIAGAEVAARTARACLTHPPADATSHLAVDAADLTPTESDEAKRWKDVLERATRPASDHRELVDALEDIGTSGWVFESVPAAIQMLVSFPEDWRAGLRALFDAGGDVDTIGSLYCSWVGALHGAAVFDDIADETQGVERLADEAQRIWGG
jgi:ADP-ribosylglycohydrolase